MALQRALSAALVLVCACDPATVGTPDARDAEAFRAGDLGDVTDCQVVETLAYVNDPATTADRLKADGVHSAAANRIPAAGPFASLFEVDDVAYVGPVAMDTLLGIGVDRCLGSVDLPPVPEASCVADTVLAWVNDPATDSVALKDGGVHGRAASAIATHRDGEDALAATADDNLFASLEEIDAVPYVGPVAMDSLEAYGGARCHNQAEVVFSPQAYDASHLVRVEAAIDSAQTSLDIAMYSFSDGMLLEALQRAVDRGVSVRFLFHGASSDRSDPAGTRSATLEDMGIEVRWVNKIQHHKFALVDGPRLDPSQASTATLLTGSGNWSYGAATRFDENMVVVGGDERLVLLFQQEFNLLWENSRDLVWNESIEDIAHVEITDEHIDAALGADAVFTSANFRTYESSRYGATFASQKGQHAVSDRLVALIESAETSIWIASGHLRSRPVAAALLAKAEARPNMDIRVYLDGQEYTSAWYYGESVADLDECLATASAPDDCDGIGVHFGYALHQAGIDLKFKYYAFRWDYHYADQMHHKYLIIDGETVASGSYNLSPNAEFDTMENVAIYDASLYPELVDAFEDNFASIWRTGDGQLGDVYDTLDGSADFPIVFAPMALDWDQITALKSAIRDACPAVDSEPYRQDPNAHRWCDR